MKKRILTLILAVLVSFPFQLIGRASNYTPISVDWSRDGYVKPGSRVKRGEVLFISKDNIEIKTEKGREKYRLTPDTIYTKRGEATSINLIKEGDKVLLSFENIYTTDALSIRIEDEERHISGVLKGKIDMVDTIGGEVWIKSPLEYKDGKWINGMKYSMKLKSSGENLYNGSKTIDLNTLKSLRGKEVYIAYDTSYGKHNIAKLKTKAGFSRQLTGKVFSIGYNTGQMVVSNSLISLDDSAIVIKDKRLVDNLNIDRGIEIDLIGERNGASVGSSIVSISTNLLDNRIDNTDIYVYRGKIEDVYDYEIEIGKLNYRKNYLMMEGMKWKEIEESRRFFFSSDTLVYDSEIKKNIDPIYLWNSRFTNLQDVKDPELKDRIKNDYYKGSQAYFVTREGEDGSEVVAINITPYKHSYGGNITLSHSLQGEIKEIDYANKTITIQNVKNYNNLNSTWERGEDEKININKGIVMINDTPIQLEEIYNIRIGSKVNVIKEKTTSLDEGYLIFIED